ncbi:MAG: hypothetical protein IPK17_30355 [Chloroflexi bacterium]|uniref:hypothetical protein n=1 Tax=Candidatus Flexifilum breve TaxID=3140694 RepID=UPI003135A3E3|nr:hypothetical protein [Chloroflexota bacterium]
MDLPPPRSGLLRHWDTLIGPGASRAEQALILGAAVAGRLASQRTPIYARWIGRSGSG